MKLNGRTAIVTGAERGIGRAIALRYATEGANVVVNFFASEQAASAVVTEIEAAGAKAIAVYADIGDVASHSALIEAALRITGRIDILVNNAGVEVRQPVLEATPETWDRTMNVNLRGAYFLSCRTAKQMKEQGGGKIIAISSVHDTRPLRDRSVYAMSKAGLTMMVKALSLELAAFQINVNGIAPGAISTHMNREHLEDATRKERLLDRIVSGRIGDVDDVTGAALFLASPDSNYVHGTTLYVDGGFLLT